MGGWVGGWGARSVDQTTMSGFCQSSVIQVLKKHKKSYTIVHLPSRSIQQRRECAWKCVLGTFSTTNRAQVGFRMRRLDCLVTPLVPFWLEPVGRSQCGGPGEGGRRGGGFSEIYDWNFEGFLFSRPCACRGCLVESSCSGCRSVGGGSGWMRWVGGWGG